MITPTSLQPRVRPRPPTSTSPPTTGPLDPQGERRASATQGSRSRARTPAPEGRRQTSLREPPVAVPAPLLGTTPTSGDDDQQVAALHLLLRPDRHSFAPTPPGERRRPPRVCANVSQQRPECGIVYRGGRQSRTWGLSVQQGDVEDCREADVAVVGAGPAGALVTVQLVRAMRRSGGGERSWSSTRRRARAPAWRSARRTRGTFSTSPSGPGCVARRARALPALGARTRPPRRRAARLPAPVGVRPVPPGDAAG